MRPALTTGVDQPAMAEVLEAARAIAASGEPDPARRRMRLLRRVAFRVEEGRRERVTARCEEAARTAARLAQLMRWPEEGVAAARLVGLLHDVGALTPESDGAEGSAAICGALGLEAGICRAVGERDRRFDGAGGCEPAAAVVAVARALCAGACGGGARSVSAALAELRRGRGTVYDPEAVVAAHLLGASAMALAA